MRNSFGAGSRITRYRVEALIATSVMSSVYLARDVELGRQVALKTLAPNLANDTNYLQRFLREPEAAAAVNHPNIIPVYDKGEVNGFPFIAMKYASGGDVQSLLEKKEPVPVARTLAIINPKC